MSEDLKKGMLAAKKEFETIEKQFFPNGDIPHDISSEEAELKYWVPRERALQAWFQKWFVSASLSDKETREK